VSSQWQRTISAFLLLRIQAHCLTECTPGYRGRSWLRPHLDHLQECASTIRRMLKEAVWYFFLAFGAHVPLQTSSFQARNRIGAITIMSFNQKSDVKKHLSARRHKTLLPFRPVSQPDSADISREVAPPEKAGSEFCTVTPDVLAKPAASATNPTHDLLIKETQE
jgi:hypothetical protein